MPFLTGKVNASSDQPGKLDLSFLHKEPADVYHSKSNTHLTSHALNDFRQCPLLYHKKQLGLVTEPDTTAYLIGRAAHALILEGREQYEREYAVGGPINPKTGQPFGSQTKAFAEWAERQGRPALSDSQAALIEQMAAAVQKHALAQHLLQDGIAEGVVRCQWFGEKCQARIDWISRHAEIGIVDLKTGNDLDSFEEMAHTFGYLYQVAFYRALVAKTSGHILPVHVIAVEKREPFRCGVWHIGEHLLSEAEYDCQCVISELAACRAADEWPTMFDGLRSFGL
ncbi:hypothetical protein AMJ85_10335 [candidate division BRC1 bacterium SM23_51]|nr:MAG: hypothetical protein AMJ85_10335 [candidate division BRC1 bacterium SM23_51]